MRFIFSLVVFIIAFLILIGMGTWQTQRLEWKENIIAQLNESYQANDTLNLTDALPPFQYGHLVGRFEYNKEILVGPKPNDGDIGYQIITPFKIQNGKYILVNRGWIAQGQKDNLKPTQPSGKLKVTGLLREAEWNRFTPNNSPENNIWTKLDIQEIAKEKNITPVMPQMLYATKTSKPFGDLRLQEAKWYPRNKHKQYAIFWFAMAGALVGVFGFYRWQSANKS